uniref:Putative secreted protein n=1 Tax=Ixodes ricinus TaxID=34613 RepID=A0A6B0U707_IXORI
MLVVVCLLKLCFFFSFFFFFLGAFFFFLLCLCPGECWGMTFDSRLQRCCWPCFVGKHHTEKKQFFLSLPVEIGADSGLRF